jgi:hypothetical protein
VKPAAYGLGLILLALPFTARADMDLVAKREICRQEARARIAPKAKIMTDEYRRIVERRNALVDQCMLRVFVARKAPPVLLKAVQQGAVQARRDTLFLQVGKKPSPVMEHAERGNWKAGSRRTLKSKKIKRSHRNKLIRHR